ncbi:MAG: S8 family serine peptidase [candidate division WOR-3 bacterium]
MGLKKGKKFIFAILPLTFLFGGEILPSLGTILQKAKPDTTIPIVLHLTEEADLSLLKGKSREEKVNYLKAFAQKSQEPIIKKLREIGITNERSFWIANFIAFKATPEMIKKIKDWEGVDYLVEDFVIQLPKLTKSTERDLLEDPEWNITKIKADSCWALGYTGEGVVVGNLDTGVDVYHPAFGNRWRERNGWFDAVAHHQTPYDDNGHGTYTMGIICGGDGFGPFPEDIGVAPGAQFIAAKGFDRLGTGWFSIIAECLQWFAGLGEDAPQVISNSWGGERTATLFWNILRNLRELEIIPVFAIGNNGPNPMTDLAPGNFPIVIGVGATDINDTVASFSSRGPAPNLPPWNQSEYWGRLDWNFIKPDLVAPGIGIRSASPGGGYIVSRGTSAAAPHIAGAVALLLDKGFSEYRAVYSALLDSSDQPIQGGPYPNNNYGWGRVNCRRAISTFQPLLNDLKTIAIHMPETVYCESSYPIQATVKNVGLLTQRDVPVKLQITGPDGYSYQGEERLSIVLGRDTARVVFNPDWLAPYYLGIVTCSVKVWTELRGDERPRNDTFRRRVKVRKKEIVFPPFYAEDFDGDWGPYGDNPPFGWRIGAGGSESPPVWNTNDWHKGRKNGRWGAMISDEILEVNNDTLISPVINCATANSVWLSYFNDYDDNERYPDSGVVLLSTDNGLSWHSIAKYKGTDDYGYVLHEITDFVIGKPTVRIAFLYCGDHGNYWLIDDFLILSESTPAFLWFPKAEFPLGPSKKKVKGGGCLVAVNDTTIYALKGNNTNDFYRYSIRNDTWEFVDSFPNSEAKKRVGKGAAITYDGRRYLYLLRGHNTKEFWRYDTKREEPVWLRLADVPGEKKVLAGAGLTYLQLGDTGYVYFLKGRRTTEWYAYNCEREIWFTDLPFPPEGPGKKRFDRGSALTTDGQNIYVLKGKTNKFYAYAPRLRLWMELFDLPPTEKAKVVRDGALTYDKKLKLIYAFKGGNSPEFWAYDIRGERWFSLTPLPITGKRRGVKEGASLAYAQDKVYALKGNNTQEFYEMRTTMSSLTIPDLLFSPAKRTLYLELPTIIRQEAKISYRVERPGRLEIILYDATGRRVDILLRRELPGKYSDSFLFNAQRLSPRIYFLFFRKGREAILKKLVITK